MSDIVDLFISISPLVLAIIIFKMIMNTMKGIRDSNEVASSSKDSKNVDYNRSTNTPDDLAMLSVSRTDKTCKNCNINKPLDDGFELCQMCKEDPKWWMVG